MEDILSVFQLVQH